MTRNLKILGIAVVMVFVTSAMFASAAQATGYWLTSDAAAGATTNLVGEQKLRKVGEKEVGDEFTTTAGVIKCSTVTYTGSIIGSTVTTMTLHPTYTGCTAFGFSATVTGAPGCNYVFHTEEGTAGGIYHSTLTLDCSGGEITVVAQLAGITKCTVHFTSQDLGTITLTNGMTVGGVKDIHIDGSMTNVKYTETAGTGGGACVSTAPGVDAENGTFIITDTVNGSNAMKNPTDIDLG